MYSDTEDRQTDPLVETISVSLERWVRLVGLRWSWRVEFSDSIPFPVYRLEGMKHRLRLPLREPVAPGLEVVSALLMKLTEQLRGMPAPNEIQRNVSVFMLIYSRRIQISRPLQEKVDERWRRLSNTVSLDPEEDAPAEDFYAEELEAAIELASGSNAVSRRLERVSRFLSSQPLVL